MIVFSTWRWLILLGLLLRLHCCCLLFCRGPVLVRGLGVARFWIVSLGGREVREVRGDPSDHLDDGDVFYVPGLLNCSSFGLEVAVEGGHGCTGWYASGWYYVVFVVGAHFSVGLYTWSWSSSPCLS